MAGFTPFTENYNDLSDEHGYQFEFRCAICGSGYRSEFQRSALGTANTLLSGASSMFGGLWGASNATNTVKNIADRGARDEALKKAANEIMPLFKQCPRDHLWVDETCWNEERGLCVNDAPKLATEMEAERAAVQLNQMRQAMESTTQFSGDTSARATVCTSCGKPVGSEKFCSNCGTPVGMAKCKSCGNDLAAGTRFCGNCGTPATA
jgi:ribosomal protein L32